MHDHFPLAPELSDDIYHQVFLFFVKLSGLGFMRSLTRNVSVSKMTPQFYKEK